MTEIGKNGVSLRQIGTTLFGRVMMMLSEAPDTRRVMLSHDGDEGGIVIAGRIELTVADHRNVLDLSGTYYFDSRAPHRFRQVGPLPCRIVSACTPPRF